MYSRTFWKLAVRLTALLAGTPFTERRHLFYPLAGAHEVSFGQGTVEWRHPVNGEQRRTSLGQLADETVQRIATLFERMESAGSLADVLNNSPGENLLTGMHGACMTAMRSKPTG
jgi:hypothetical protein